MTVCKVLILANTKTLRQSIKKTIIINYSIIKVSFPEPHSGHL